MTVKKKQGIGNQIRRLRRARELNLQDLSDLTGMGISTLSKIENDIVDPTYVKMVTISEALGVNVSEILSGASARGNGNLPSARRSITRHGMGVVTSTQNYDCEYLNTELSKKQMIPVVATVKSKTLEEFGAFVPHQGEEIIYVLDGEIEVHTEHYEPIALKKGDSIYLDCMMGHGMISKGARPATVLFVCTHAIPDRLDAEAIDGSGPKRSTARQKQAAKTPRGMQRPG